MRATPNSLNSYPHHLTIPTRWADNDAYGHVNNSVYYFYFDTVVNKWLIENGLLEIGQSDTIGLVVGTSCDYFAPISFPDDVVAALRAAKVGSSSVTYEIGLFRNEETTASAQGSFVHVYVDEKNRRPTAISAMMKEKLGEITPC
ncbi:thioesterase [Litorimonas cladophorae]|uniref:Thioesterase n=1 Tax=Litorimonas cladophorae TaxID=1220491 RepID=A0A918KJK8_9PROT|nr:thioesterase family protein [Litorimonas cladophorae]GGX63409.1 thioesterase [Litorimonas cladophorae]